MGKTVSTAGRGVFSSGFLRIFRFFFLFIFLIIPLIYAIILSVQSQSIQPGVEYLGQKFLNPLMSLNNASLQIIKYKAAYISTGHLFSDIWAFILLYWNLLGSLYIIYRWIKLFSWLYGRSPFSNESQKFVNNSLATLTFLVLTLLYLSLIANSVLKMSVQASWKIPFDATSNFFKAFPYLIKSANNIISKPMNQLPNIQNATNISGM